MQPAKLIPIAGLFGCGCDCTNHTCLLITHSSSCIHEKVNQGVLCADQAEPLLSAGFFRRSPVLLRSPTCCKRLHFATHNMSASTCTMNKAGADILLTCCLGSPGSVLTWHTLCTMVRAMYTKPRKTLGPGHPANLLTAASFSHLDQLLAGGQGSIQQCYSDLICEAFLPNAHLACPIWLV